VRGASLLRLGRRLVEALGFKAQSVADDRVPAVFGVIDKLERVPRAAALDALGQAGVEGDAREAIVSLPAATIEMVRAALEKGPDRSLVEDFCRYLDYLSALGVGDYVRLDLSVVRGLAYYTGIVFEIFDARGEFRAVCGGGRYDKLLQALGGVDLPALGFGMGDVVLGELLRSRGLLRRAVAGPEWWVAAREERQLPSVMRVAAALRSCGESVEYALRPQSLARQLKTASGLGVARVVILADDFDESNRITLKPLLAGAPEEEHLSLHAMLDALSRDRARPPAARVGGTDEPVQWPTTRN